MSVKIHIVTALMIFVIGVGLICFGCTAPVRMDTAIEGAQQDAYLTSPIPGPRQKDMHEYDSHNRAEIRGAIEYCTGWIVIALAGVVFTSGRRT
jgi:hypothetical protein